MTRVTDRMRYASTQNRINTVRQFADDVQETAVSGRKLRKTSDDPVGAVRVLRNRTKLENIEQYRKTLDFARGYLQKTETALLGINETLIRAKELAVQQSNAIWDPDSRSIVAQEVRQLADHIVELGNSTYGDRYVFGGFQTSEPPINSEGHFLGDDGVIFVQVDEDSLRPINVSGREVFDVPPEEEGKTAPLVQTLRRMYIALTSNNLEELHDCMSNLDDALKRTVKSTATLGARRSAVDEITTRLEHNEENLLSDNNNLESADPVKSALDMKRAETALQYTLSSSAKILTPTLLSFLQGG